MSRPGRMTSSLLNAMAPGAEQDDTAKAGRPKQAAHDRPHLTIRGNRARVLNGLQRRGQPMTPYEIMYELRKTGRCWPTTVYRALDQLETLGVVHRMASRSAFIACKRPTTPDEIHVVAVCDHCGGVEEFPMRSILPETLKASRSRAFEVTGPSLELHVSAGSAPVRPATRVVGGCPTPFARTA